MIRSQTKIKKIKELSRRWNLKIISTIIRNHEKRDFVVSYLEMKVEIFDQTVNFESYVLSHAAGRTFSWNGTAWSYRQGRPHAGRCSARMNGSKLVGHAVSRMDDGWAEAWRNKTIPPWDRVRPVRWPARSPDLSRCDFFLGLHEVQNLRHSYKTLLNRIHLFKYKLNWIHKIIHYDV